MRMLAPAERLIVAADFKPDLLKGNGRSWVRRQVLMLADSLKGTGVYLKTNSILRACGYDLIDEIHNRGLKVFADLKFYDIGETLSTDGALLKEFKPELVTVACIAGV
ncbi:MAG: orotidine 5'-phosphate decarboxylase / HUMPS family protein, partial [Pseudorhodobacter sp.]|nr:orotidine 5'-phosphate decarboxylase / HUMPS family protein [Pseudorhodobacter sp.]